MGDFNISGRDANDLAAGPGYSFYHRMAESLGPLDVTTFEQTMHRHYSHRRDLGLGFKEACDDVPPVCGTDTVMPDEVHTLIRETAGVPISLFGQGTKAPGRDGSAGLYNPESSRLDYIWLLPPVSTNGELPAYAVWGGPETGPEPVVTITPDIPIYGSWDQANETASDHSAVFAAIPFANVTELPGYTPAHTYRTTYIIDSVKALSKDCWGCGPNDFFGHMILNKNTGPVHKSEFPVISNVDEPSCNWFVGNPAGDDILGYGDQAFWTFVLRESDWGSPPDTYDTTLWAGKWSFSEFWQEFGMWRMTDEEFVPQCDVCLASIKDGCPVPYPSTLQPTQKTRGNAAQKAEVRHRMRVELVVPENGKVSP